MFFVRHCTLSVFLRCISCSYELGIKFCNFTEAMSIQGQSKYRHRIGSGWVRVCKGKNWVWGRIKYLYAKTGFGSGSDKKIRNMRWRCVTFLNSIQPVLTTKYFSDLSGLLKRNFFGKLPVKRCLEICERRIFPSAHLVYYHYSF